MYYNSTIAFRYDSSVKWQVVTDMSTGSPLVSCEPRLLGLLARIKTISEAAKVATSSIYA